MVKAKIKGPRPHKIRWNVDAKILNHRMDEDMYGWTGALRSSIRTWLYRRVIRQIYIKFIGARADDNNTP